MGRDVEMLARKLRRKGWRLIRKTKHGWLYETPNGFTQLIPGTPGDKRSLANLDGQIKRNRRIL